MHSSGGSHMSRLCAYRTFQATHARLVQLLISEDLLKNLSFQALKGAPGSAGLYGLRMHGSDKLDKVRKTT